eukprot:4124168-Ditylum_brightwellii.AAC.1
MYVLTEQQCKQHQYHHRAQSGHYNECKSSASSISNNGAVDIAHTEYNCNEKCLVSSLHC